MHERSAGKVGMYTRFFDYANYHSVKNWNGHFFWVDEFVVPANARFNWFSGSNISKDRAPAASEYNVKHVSILITHASPFLRFPEEFLCWVGISRNYLLNKDTYPRFEYESGEEMDLNAFIRTADPRKVRIVERARAENERPIVTVAKHRTVTLVPTSVVRPSGDLSASIEREFVGDAGGSGGGDQKIASVGGHDNVEVSAARNLSLSSEVRMRAEYNILEKKKWKSLAEEKNNLLQVKDMEIEELRSQLLQAKDESVEVARLRTLVSSLEAIEGSLRGEVAFAQEHNGLLEQEHSALKLKVTSLESIVAEKDRELSDLGASASSLRSQNKILVNQVHELETSSAGLREKLKMYEGRRWLLTHGMKLLMAKCLNSTEYIEALGNAFGRAIEKGMQEGLAAGIEHGQAGRCLSDLEAYNPSVEADFNSVVRDLHDVMNLLRLDDAVAEVLGMTDLQPDVGQFMVPVHHRQDKFVIGSQALSVALETCHRRITPYMLKLWPFVPTTDNVVAEIEAPGPKRSKKKRVPRGSEGIPAASHPPKRLRADYGTTGGSAVGGKSPSVLNRLLQDSLLTVEQGVPALPALPFITSSVTASPLEEGGDHTDFVTGPFLRTVCRFGADYGTTVTAFVSSVAATTTTSVDVGKDKDVPAPSVFTYSRGDADVDLQEIYIPEWSVTKGFKLNDGRSCANMIDHFTPPAFFQTVRGMEHEQLFAEFNVSAARNLSLSSEVRMRAEYNILEKKKWKSLAEEKDNLLLEAIEGSLRGEVASAKDHNGLLEQEHSALKLKVTNLESIIAERDRELSDLGTSALSLRSQNQSLVNQVHELETSSGGLREKLKMYEGSMRQLGEFQDSLVKPLEARLAEIDADFTRCCMHFQENFHPHLLNAIAGRRWLLTHGMKLLMAKCLNSTEYMEALGNAFGRAIEKGMQEGLAAGIKHGQAGRCLSDLEAYNPSAEANFNSAVRDLRDLDFSLLRDLSAKKDASTLDVMDLLRLDDAVAETCHRRVRKMERNLAERLPLLKDVFVSIDHPVSAKALAILSETSTKPPATTLITTALSTVVIRPNSDPFLLVKDYKNPDLAGVVPEDVIPWPEGEGNVEGSTKGDVDEVFS
ncbi:hypothetical protein Tco_0351105 [Tanacetum coccineum]